MPLQDPAMRFFVARQRLEDLAPHTRLLVSGLMVGVAFQAVSGLLMQHAGPGWSPASVARYFRGDDGGAPVQQAVASDPFAGLDGGDALDAGVIALPKSFEALMEVAHWHLAMIPLLIFLAAHCCALTGLGKRPPFIAIGIVTGIGGVGVIAAPFLVRYLGAGWAPMQIASVLLVDAGLIVLALVTITACVLGGRKADRPNDSG